MTLSIKTSSSNTKPGNRDRLRRLGVVNCELKLDWFQYSPPVVGPLEVLIWIPAFLIIRKRFLIFFTCHSERQQVLDKTKKPSHTPCILCTPCTIDIKIIKNSYLSFPGAYSITGSMSLKLSVNGNDIARKNTIISCQFDMIIFSRTIYKHLFD